MFPRNFFSCNNHLAPSLNIFSRAFALNPLPFLPDPAKVHSVDEQQKNQAGSDSDPSSIPVYKNASENENMMFS